MRRILCCALVCSRVVSLRGPAGGLSARRVRTIRRVETPRPVDDVELVNIGGEDDISPFALSKEESMNCARGVCVVDETVPEMCEFDEAMEEIVCVPADAPLWPKALLLVSSVFYGTNFALGRLMNDALPASASTSARFVLAGVALSPFLLKLSPGLVRPALICGCFTALGYVSQSLALVDTPAATVAFLGALTVVVCPTCAYVLEKRTDLGFRDAPQIWLAAGLSLAGVAFLELPGLAAGDASVGLGDALSVLQAVGFGTSFYLTEKMMQREPDQALSITAAQVSVTALIAALWALCDGYGIGPFSGHWLIDGRETAALPGLFLFGADDARRSVALAAAWTGLVTTAMNRVAETVALGKVSSSEASVLLATEPLWAAAFGALLIGEALDGADYAGGALICLACVTAASDKRSVEKFLRRPGGGDSAT